MSRKILGDNVLFKAEQDSDRKVYNPAEENLFDSELIKRLWVHYLHEKESGLLPTYFWTKKNFGFEVQNLKFIIKECQDKNPAQLLLEVLSSVFQEDSMYLTALVQALFHLNYGNEFTIDTSGWPDRGYQVGRYLRGRENKPIILNLYGNFQECGWSAEYCDFVIHGLVEQCGRYAKHCNYTFYDMVGEYGFDAENCRFDFMPDAEVKNYLRTGLKGNVVRRMRETGKWEIVK